MSMPSQSPRNVLLLLSVVAALCGCKGKPAPAGAGAAAAPSSAAPKAAPPAPAAKDPELMHTLTTLAETCQQVPGEDRVN